VGHLFQSFDEMPRVLGTLNTVKGPENEGIQWFAEEVRKLSGGNLQLIPLRPSQIGSAVAQVDQLMDFSHPRVCTGNTSAPFFTQLSLYTRSSR
jgi:TRAP-type C4-dicarboxylate transport system substrate-binding protein